MMYRATDGLVCLLGIYSTNPKRHRTSGHPRRQTGRATTHFPRTRRRGTRRPNGRGTGFRARVVGPRYRPTGPFKVRGRPTAAAENTAAARYVTRPTRPKVVDRARHTTKRPNVAGRSPSPSRFPEAVARTVQRSAVGRGVRRGSLFRGEQTGRGISEVMAARRGRKPGGMRAAAARGCW